MTGNKMNILIVEDSPVNIDILVNLLKDTYNLFVSINGKGTIGILKKQKVDLILLDIMLPDVNGLELMKRIRKNKQYGEIPVIFLSNIDDPNVKTECFQAGAIDYITKPYNALEIMERIKTRINLIKANRILNQKQEVLEEMIQIKTEEIIKTRDAAVRAVSSLVETRDSSTNEHINRTQKFVAALATTLKGARCCDDILTDEYIMELERASVLHDIGKIGIPDNVLLKPGKLTEDEFEIIKEHPRIGYEALKSASDELGDNLFFDIAKDIALYHHEKWDGSGYPKGLMGNEIPLSARIMALSDVYDALTSERVYKKAMNHEEAKLIIIAGKRGHFDPEVVDAFRRIDRMFEKIAFQLSV